MNHKANPDQGAPSSDPAELNAEDLNLLNDGVLQQVVGGAHPFNNTTFKARP
jgi:hypothetical protein